MIYLSGLEKIEGSKYKARLTARDVKDRANKRVMSVEEFAKQVLENKEGIVVEVLSEPEKISGKEAVRCVNLDTQEVFYEYEDAPITEEKKISILEKQVAELSFLVMQLQGGTKDRKSVV